MQQLNFLFCIANIPFGKRRNNCVKTSVHAFPEVTAMKKLLDECNCKIKVVAITGEPMKDKDQVECCYLKDKVDSLMVQVRSFPVFYSQNLFCAFPE